MNGEIRQIKLFLWRIVISPRVEAKARADIVKRQLHMPVLWFDTKE